MNSLTQFRKIAKCYHCLIRNGASSHGARLRHRRPISLRLLCSTGVTRLGARSSRSPPAQRIMGTSFPARRRVYMGIVHAAIYDAAVAIEGGYEPYAIALIAPPHTSSAAAIATAAHHTLVGCPDCNPPHSGLQPPLGLTPEQQAILDGDYANYLAAIPDGTAKTNGIAVGEQVAAAVVALRTNDGRELNPTLEDLNPPPPGPGIWEPNAGDPPPPVLGLRLPGITPACAPKRVAVSSRRPK